MSQIQIGLCIIEYRSTRSSKFKSVFPSKELEIYRWLRRPQQDARVLAWKTEQSWPERTPKPLPCPLYTEIVYEQLGRPEPEKHIVV